MLVWEWEEMGTLNPFLLTPTVDRLGRVGSGIYNFLADLLGSDRI